MQIGSATYAPNANLGNNLLQIKSPSGFAYLTIGNGDTANATSYIGGASGFTVIGSVTDAGALSEHARITNTGNVGIGTTSPGTALQVGGLDDGSNYDITLGWNAVDSEAVGTKRSAITFKTGQTSVNTEDIYKWDIAMLAAPATVTNEEFGSDLAFLRSTRGSTATDATTMILTRTGNVGIGTTSPAYRLDVAGTSRSDLHIFRSNQSAPTADAFIFRPADNTVALGTANAERVRIDSSGNVGIGTTSPQSQLHIYKSNSGGIGGELRLDNNNAAVGNKTRILFSDGGGGSASFDRAAIVAQTEASPYKGQLQFQTGYATLITKMIITGDGNVGIGTTSPGAKLDIHTATNTNGLLIREDSDDSITHNFYIDSSDNGVGVLYANGQSAKIQLNTAGNSYFNGGNVGIGTTAPDTNLHIEDSNPFLTLRGNSAAYSNAGIQLISGHASNNRALGIFHYVENSDVEWFAGLPYSGNDEYVINRNTGYTVPSSQSSPAGIGASAGRLLTVKSSGNVGIGTTAPQQALHIKGATNGLMMLEGDNDNGIAGCYYKTEDTDDTMNRTKGFFGFQGNNTWGLGYFTMWLDNVGDNGTVTASEERFRWERDGDFHADGDVIAYSTTTPSDIRLKTDVETIESASKKVSKLRGVEYTWSKGKLAGQREIGLIAQEVEAVVPEVVKEKKLPLWDDSGESYKTVDYDKLVALLIESNKEMQEEIKKLKERLDGFTK